MDKRYQEMVFDIEPYKFGNTIEEARDLMWRDIAKFLQLLSKQGNIAVVYDDDVDIIVIQYDHYESRGNEWGVPNPHWVNDEEFEEILISRDSNDEE